MLERCALLMFLAPLLVLGAQPSLMPWPSRIEIGQGSLAIGATLRIAFTGYSEPRLEAAARRLGDVVKDSPTLVIDCQRTGADESYHLTVTSQGARLSALNPTGVLRGLETFRQLIAEQSVPVLDIDDHPRFVWRGLHLDVSRHWMPIEVVKR